MAGILVIAEVVDGTVTPLTRELLGLARAICDRQRDAASRTDIAGKGQKASVGILAFTRHRAVLDDFGRWGADRVYWCEHGEEYEGELWVGVAGKLARDTGPVAILVGHTPAGADLGPRLAFRLGGGVATGCTEVSQDAATLLFTRSCFGGNVRETLSFSTEYTVATIRPGVGNAVCGDDRKAELVQVALPDMAPRVRVLARERDAGDAKRLEDAKVIVAGGRGLEGPEGFRVLEDLAAVLGGAVGASRVPCDLGWCSHAWQIGLTGKTVAPDLYIAVGISGAGHHMAGCGNAKTIVAINTDPDAAIFKDARYGLIGDYRKLVPALTAAVTALKRDASGPVPG